MTLAIGSKPEALHRLPERARWLKWCFRPGSGAFEACADCPTVLAIKHPQKGKAASERACGFSVQQNLLKIAYFLLARRRTSKPSPRSDAPIRPREAGSGATLAKA